MLRRKNESLAKKLVRIFFLRTMEKFILFVDSEIRSK